MRKPLIKDPFNHIDLDGTPYMWALLGEWEVAGPDSPDDGQGKYLRGKCRYTTRPAEAWRGEEGWTNYHVLVDVRLDTDNAQANIYFRHRYVDPYYYRGDFEYYSWALSYEAPYQAKFQLWKHWVVDNLYGGWQYDSLLPSAVIISPFDRQSWHLLEVRVRNIEQGVEIECFLDGQLLIDPAYIDSGASGDPLPSGRVGVAVQKNENSGAGDEIVSFDNVVVLDIAE